MREYKYRYHIIFIQVILCVLICAGCQRQPEESSLQELKIEKADTSEDTDKIDEKELEEDRAQVWVYICGAVNQPGVYTFDSEVHICEALREAGGLTEQAAQTYLNQAQLIRDGEQLYVPTQEEIDTGAISQVNLNPDNDIQKNQTEGLLNINSATLEELMTLSGIGEAKAQSIITYRQDNGDFQNIEDIMQIEGIKEGVFNKIKDDITV